jgi:putative acetyltransferase
MVSSVELANEDPGAAESLELIRDLLAELWVLYGDEWQNPFQPEELSGPRSAFLVARMDGRAVGCGGFRRLDDGCAELRRVYVAPPARRLGIAQSILARLEDLARDACYETVRLETGSLQPEALRLYERAGYRRIAPYGIYASDPSSVCFEKALITQVGRHGT